MVTLEKIIPGLGVFLILQPCSGNSGNKPPGRYVKELLRMKAILEKTYGVARRGNK
jgi:hypothetical protein